jgi:hypothetical protein
LTGPGRLGRGAWVAIPLLLYAAACLFVWTDDSWRQHWDSGLYVLTARSLAAGEGYTYLDEPFFLRPPGLSWLIAAVQGDGAFDPARLNRMMRSSPPPRRAPSSSRSAPSTGAVLPWPWRC